MSQAASEKLIDLVKKSELVPPKKLDGFLEKASQKPGGVPADQGKLAELLVEDGLLTRWQADKLLAGKHRGFRLGKYKLLGQIAAVLPAVVGGYAVSAVTLFGLRVEFGVFAVPVTVGWFLAAGTLSAGGFSL